MLAATEFQYKTSTTPSDSLHHDFFLQHVPQYQFCAAYYIITTLKFPHPSSNTRRMRQTIEDKENLSILRSLLAPEIYARLRDRPSRNASKAKSQRRKERKERKRKAGEIFHIEDENQDEGFFVHEPESPPVEEKQPEFSADSEKQLDEDKELGEFVDASIPALLSTLRPDTDLKAFSTSLPLF
jgi:hypothetical protein